MSEARAMPPHDQIVADIGRKCADDVAGAIRRNMRLTDSQREAMIVSAYAAAAAIGAANGAFAAFMNGPGDIDAAFVDQLWSEFLRPMVLGELVSGARSTMEGLS